MWQLLIAVLLVSASTAGSRARPEAPSVAFAALRRPRSYFARYFAISALLHFLLVGVIVFATELIRESDQELRLSRNLLSIYTPIRITTPDTHYYPVRSPIAVLGTHGTHAEQRTRLAGMARDTAGQVLIRPDTPLTPRSEPLPAFLYWQPAAVPAPDQTLTPGSKQTASASLPSADASRQAPNTEILAGSVSLPRSEAKPNVPVPPSNSVPVTLPSPPDLHELAGGGTLAGVPIAVVSIAPRLPAKDEVASVPRASSLAGGAGDRQPSGADRNSRANEATAAVPTETVSKVGPGSAAGSREHGEPTVQVIDSRAGRLEVHVFPDGSREVQYPKDGRFDAVVVQATAGDLVHEATELLTGRPVQTVYLAVETGREWILQFSLPHGSETPTSQSGMIVSLGKHTKLEPPWVLTAALPPHGAQISKSSVYYGTLRASGHFYNMRALSGPQYEPRPELLAYLKQWEFRPALQDGVAADVEVVLIVPPGATL
jgi:hypothetical protein